MCRPFYVLAQFLLTTGESELDYWLYQLPDEFPKNLRLRKFQKIAQKLGIFVKSPASHLKAKFRQLSQKIAKNYLQSFVNDCTWLWPAQFYINNTPSKLLPVYSLQQKHLKSENKTLNYFSVQPYRGRIHNVAMYNV